MAVAARRESARAGLHRAGPTRGDRVLRAQAGKQAYRDLLIVDAAQVKLVYLRGSQALITQRLAQRAGHFFDPRLLQSQFDSLEEPADAIVVDIAKTPEKIADAVIARLGL
jgi:gluconokinase